MPKEIILKVIHLCLESGLKVLINTTISNTNFTNIERMCEEAISIGATAIRFTNFLKQGNVLKIVSKNMLYREMKLIYSLNN